MNFIKSFAIALAFVGLSTATQANNDAKSNDYTIAVSMKLSPDGEMEGLSIQVENYSGETFNKDMNRYCRGFSRYEESIALIFDFKSSEKTDEENSQLLPVPSKIIFQCSIP